ncbi:MAG: hypothetical protein ACLFQQ_20965 [Desulfococcaceae bacterium]
MAFARQYTETEVRGMLRIMEGNVNQFSPVPANKRKPAHAVKEHGGADFLSMKTRVLTAGNPKKTSAYKDFDTMVRATTEILNSAAGQTELAKIDNGTQKRATIRANLTNGNYHSCKVETTNHTDLSANENFKRATAGMVICEKFVGSLLQIQTSFPTTLV